MLKLLLQFLLIFSVYSLDLEEGEGNKQTFSVTTASSTRSFDILDIESDKIKIIIESSINYDVHRN